MSVPDEIVPPWIKYPGMEPWWGSWRQGVTEAWFAELWFPFWKGLSREKREEYLRNWPPPSDEWLHYLTVIWK